ncbi:serine hydrolase domain-containing protein [Fulvivirgaceae bacterium BMA12]|uniref:Serine hydrolase domain-containing protein n=1 Tax=Agaribacillus aureus TaxID=3051825 RepID=A0ABT8L2L4_9BACT|nr:serine hydrolase domain-containing protein [Fulvivirgaceae bacterium BMA12]
MERIPETAESSYTQKSSIDKIDGTQVAASELGLKIQELVDSAHVTGLAISIFNDNDVVYKHAFGKANASNGVVLKTNHVFYGASFSKAVFGYLVAGLVNDGLIDLDKPLQEYFDVPIPELPFEKDWRSFKDLQGDKRYENITASMCLSHTTGLPNWRWIPRPGQTESDEKLKIYFEPGTLYSYSGEGMMLLQYAIEKVTGKGLEQLARERIFDPLKMKTTSYIWQDRFEYSYCHGHTIQQEVIRKDKHDEAGAAGSMETTLDDYSKFVRHILQQTADSSKITNLMFSPGTRIRSKAQFGPLALEETDENDDIELSYGLGWGLLKSPYGYGAFKEGHGEGFQHYSIIFPEKQIGVIMMSNSDNAESIFKALLEITIGDVYTPWKWEHYIPYNYKGP